MGITNKIISVVAKCVGCGLEKEIKSGEVAELDYPFCPKCYMPMIAKKAKNGNK